MLCMPLEMLALKMNFIIKATILDLSARKDYASQRLETVARTEGRYIEANIVTGIRLQYLGIVQRLSIVRLSLCYTQQFQILFLSHPIRLHSIFIRRVNGIYFLLLLSYKRLSRQLFHSI